VNLHRAIPLVALALNLILLGSALAAERKTVRTWVFAWFAAALAVWNLGVFGLRAAADPATAMQWERFIHLGVIPMPALFYHYVLAFLDEPRGRSTLRVGYALAVFFLVVSPTPLFMTGVTDSLWGYMPAQGPFYTPFFVYYETYVVLGLIRLLRALRTPMSSFRRNRTRLVIAGVLLGICGGVFDFVRFLVGWERLYPIGIPSNALFALALGVAIVRYRLLDIGILAKRLVLYLLTALALAPCLFFGLYVVESAIPGRPFAPNLRYVTALMLGFMAALPLLRRLEDGLSAVMFAREHGVRDALVALSKDLASVLDIATLGRALTEGLTTRVPVLHASLHLHDAGDGGFAPFAVATSPAFEGDAARVRIDERLALRLRLDKRPLAVEEIAFHPGPDEHGGGEAARLEAARVALLVPLLLEGELAAILVVGEKVSGALFEPAEIKLLEMLAGQTAITLKNSRLYADLRGQMDALQRTQQQLVQSAKLAAIGELAASVAHEINNPLMVILGNAQMALRRGDVDSALAGRLANIETEAVRAGKIIRGLLDFARRREPNRELLHLEGLVRRALDLLVSKLVRARVEVEAVFDPAVTLIHGDGDQLTQVFINLIVNAVDAMPDGGTLTVRTELRAEAGTVAIRFGDTGVGMTAEQAMRVFEPFYTTKPEGQGTGLGLSVSLGIVRNHHGTIEIASEPGKGTTMTIELPAPPVPPAAS
jgi:signal transduction histidine kinase